MLCSDGGPRSAPIRTPIYFPGITLAGVFPPTPPPPIWRTASAIPPKIADYRGYSKTKFGDEGEREAERSDLHRIHLNAHGRLLLTSDHHPGDAGDLTDVLGQDILGVIVDLGQRQCIRSNGKDKDRRVRRINLPVGWR